jgi:hypothetical protein
VEQSREEREMYNWAVVKLYPMLNEVPHHKCVWGSGGISPCILNLATNLDEVKWLASNPAHLTSREGAPSTHQVGPELVCVQWQREKIPAPAKN